jgi:hypothetical protein
MLQIIVYELIPRHPYTCIHKRGPLQREGSSESESFLHDSISTQCGDERFLHRIANVNVQSETEWMVGVRHTPLPASRC